MVASSAANQSRSKGPVKFFNREKSGTDANETGQKRLTHFTFKHRVFEAPGALFTLRGLLKEPMFGVDLGGGLGFITLNDLRKTFGIANDSFDSELIGKAANGLKFVPDIKPGDKIPNELIDGTASWSVTEKHKFLAKARIQAQLLSWMSGKEQVITDFDELSMFFGQIENKKRLREAFNDAASAIEVDDPQIVVDRIEALARELCFIEALRDKFSTVEGLHDKLEVLTEKYRSDRRYRDEIQRIKMLLTSAANIFRNIFLNVDAQTSEIIGALKGIDQQIDFIRASRDKIHFNMLEWDKILIQWHEMQLVRSRNIELLLQETYRFLASRHAPSRSMIN